MKRIGIVLLIGLLTVAGCKKNDIIKPSITGGPGESAEYYLSSEDYKAVAIEVVYVDGYKPTDQAMTNLTNWMQSLVNKPNGISTSYKSISSPSGVSTYTVEKLRELEDSHRTGDFDDETMPLYIFFADKGYSTDDQNSKTLGLAYRNTSFAIFEQSIQDYSGGLGEPSTDKLETTILEHEMGHLLGLVDLGTPMQTTHRANGHHCDESSCLMYYTVETNDVVANLLGSPIPELDQNCRNDLQVAGGK